MKITTQKQAEQARKEIEHLDQLYQETGKQLAEYSEALFVFEVKERLNYG